MSKIIQLKVQGVVVGNESPIIPPRQKLTKEKFAFSPIFISHRNLSNGTTTSPDQSL